MLKRSINNIVLLCIIYLYIHNPLFQFVGGIGSCKLLYPIAGCYFLANFRNSISIFRFYKAELLFMLSLLLFTVLRTVLGGNPKFVYDHFIFLIECFVLPVTFAVYWCYNKKSTDLLITFLLMCSALGGIISTICMSVPSVDLYVRFQLQSVGEYLSENLFRGFGISDSLTWCYGYVQAASIILGIYNLKRNKWFVFFIPFITISVVLNARTGIIILILGLLLYFLYYRKIKNLFLFSFIFLLLILVSYFLFPLLKLGEGSMWFIQSFFDEFQGKSLNSIHTNSGTISTLYDMFILPDNFQDWFLGKGIDLFHKKGFHSDVGYSNQLFYGGLVYIFILYSFILRLYNGFVSRANWGLFGLFFILTMIILNIKGGICSNNGYLRFVLLIYFVAVLNYKKYHKTIV